MKQPISSTFLLQIVLAFTLVFSAFLALTISYNKTFKMKNEAISIIEKYEGPMDKAVEIINNYLKNNGYNTKGYCKAGEYGIASLNNITFSSNTSQKYYYCISYHCGSSGCSVGDSSAPNGNKIFYDFKMFYKFNLSYFGDIFTFDIKGETKGIYLYTEDQKIS